MQSRRNSVSVPGFYKTKHVGQKTTSTTKLPEKPPVVIRRGGPTSEIIRPNKESVIPNQDHDIFCEVKTKNPAQNLGSLSAGLFKETIEEIN